MLSYCIFLKNVIYFIYQQSNIGQKATACETG